MTESTIKLAFARLAKRADVPRLHIHLLRHAFATRYLLNGGEFFSLQRILGHSTLEMTRRYVDTVAMDAVVKQKPLTAMDHLFTGNKGAEANVLGRTAKHSQAFTPNPILDPYKAQQNQLRTKR